MSVAVLDTLGLVDRAWSETQPESGVWSRVSLPLLAIGTFHNKAALTLELAPSR